MRDKGHCFLNFDREPELLDFWEMPPPSLDTTTQEQGQFHTTSVSSTELRFSSGKIIGSRHADAALKKAATKKRRALLSPSPSTLQALPSASEDTSLPPLLDPHPPKSRQLARREEMSILGITAQQRQALVLAEKKAQRSEAVARRARQWAYDRAGNAQKCDQINTTAKMGRQNHKLMPR